MRRGTVLILGLVCLAGLFAYAAIITAPAIQADIQDRTAQVLAAAGMDFVDVGTDGRDVTITGAAPDAAARDAVLGLGNGLRGVRLVRDEMTVLDPPVSPFTFSALTAPDGISLSGFVPDEATKTALADQAQALFGGQVNDDTIIARGAPDAAWGEAVAAGLAQLPNVTNGELAVEDTTISIMGSLASESDAAALESALLAALPEGYGFQSGFDVPPPLIVVEPAPTGALAVVDESGEENAEAAEEPEGSEEAAAPEAPEGEQAVEPVAEPEAVAEAESEAVAPAPAPPVEPIESVEACQDQLDRVLASQTIQFSSSSAVISADSYDLLNALGTVAGRCVGSQIAIEGHTDSSGSLQPNIDLSLARAQAVMEYLVGLGIERSRLSAFGYGPTLPVSSNDTEEGRANNRRIEFKVEQ